MSNIKENPRYNVISMRISEAESRLLKTLMRKSHKSVSHVMREAFTCFAAHIEQRNESGSAA